MSLTHHALPTGYAVLAQQIALTVGSLRREAIAIGVILALLAVFAATGGLGRDPLVAEPSFLIFALPVAAMLPMAVWRGDDVFGGHAFLWSIPCRRHVSAAARVIAGALWLIAAMSLTLLALATIAWSSGGQMGAEEVRFVSPTLAIGSARRMQWSTPWWEYAVPFTAALIVYFFASAALLGLRHPMRWILGVSFGLAVLVALILRAAPGSPLAVGMESLRHSLWLGDFGLSHALTGGNEARAHELELPGGGRQVVWAGLPTLEAWLRATGAWMLGALACVWLAIWRHAER